MWGSAQLKRLIIIVLIYAALLAGGIWLGGIVRTELLADAAPLSMPMMNAMLATTLAIYVLASACPFVPGAEIGLGLLMVFGAKAAAMVYGAMVLALLLAFAIGHAVPVAVIAATFRRLRMERAATLMLDLARMRRAERLQHLLGNEPGRIVPVLLRHRYLALIVALNVPGNTVIGGGGGIAMAAGLSRLFHPVWFVATLLIAVAPIPLLFCLGAL